MSETTYIQQLTPTERMRTADFFDEHQRAVSRSTSRFFAVLLPIQWLAGIAAAYVLSPLTWHGENSSVNPHLWFAIFVGGAVTSFPLFLTITHPESSITRHVVAVGQMLMSAVLIHVTGGRIETHFHIFGSLAFLAFYRDWRVIITATIVTAGDHFFRGYFYPYSIYGVLTVDPWRWFEHAGWVVFTDIFLIAACKRNIKEMWEIARRTAICIGNEERYRAVVEQTTDGIVLIEPENLHVIECNEAFSRLIACGSVEEAKTLTGYDFSTAGREELLELSKALREQKTTITRERIYRRCDGSLVEVEVSANLISYNESNAFCLSVKDITDRKKAEAEINRLALVAQKTQNAVVITDPEGYVQWVNDGFTRITGFEKSDIVGLKPGKLLQGKDTDPETKAAIREAVEARKPFDGEIYNYGKDGRGYWLSISIMPIRDEQGTLQGFIAVEAEISERKAMEEKVRHAYDDLELKITERTSELVQANEFMQIEISERRRAEAEAGETREFLRSVIDNVPYPIFVKDIEGKYVLGNQALADVRGTTVENLIGKSRLDFGGDPDANQAFTDEDIELLDNLESILIPQEMNRDSDGKLRWYQTAKRSITLGKNETRFLIGVATDITERRLAEIELSEARQFLTAVIDNVPNLIFVKDITGNFVLANKAIADVFGITPEELIGKTDADFSHNQAEAKKFTEEDIKLLQDMEERFIPEEEHTDTDGNVHWFQTVKKPVILGDNGARFLIGVATDFTERKIMESQMRHSQKMESIGQLAAGIAHEINTPTQYVGDNTRFASDAFKDISLVLSSYGELLRSAETGEIKPELLSEVKKQLDDADLEYLMTEVPNALQQSLDGVSRIAKIVQSMKDFAHPGTLVKQTIDLNRAIESTVTVAANEWKYVADLETNFDPTLPLVPCYLGEFNQVVLNMIVNAAHAIGDVVGDGGQGKGKITITTKKVSDDWAEVRIGDTGNGIPAEIRGRVFDPFFTTKEVGKGTGQGLAISHTVVVDKHGGQLSIESEEKCGTTFIIRLPLNNFEESDKEGCSND
ncbi:MAG: PAS domain S-box protein [Acidobacteriota bacterium]